MLNCKEVGRKPPNFGDASIVATELLNSGYEFDQGSVIFNRFRYDACSALFFFFFIRSFSGLISPFFVAGLLSHTRRTRSLCFPLRQSLMQVVSVFPKEVFQILRRPNQKYTEYMCFRVQRAWASTMTSMPTCWGTTRSLLWSTSSTSPWRSPPPVSRVPGWPLWTAPARTPVSTLHLLPDIFMSVCLHVSVYPTTLWWVGMIFSCGVKCDFYSHLFGNISQHCLIYNFSCVCVLS